MGTIAIVTLLVPKGRRSGQGECNDDTCRPIAARAYECAVGGAIHRVGASSGATSDERARPSTRAPAMAAGGGLAIFDTADGRRRKHARRYRRRLGSRVGLC